MNQALDSDCGECPSGVHCWQEPIDSGCGFIAQRLRPFASGETIVRQGDVFDAPRLVTSGCVAITESSTAGRERIVAFRLPGELVGVESWDGPSHLYGAQAIGPVTTCRLRWTRAGIAARPLPVVRRLLVKVSAQLAQSLRLWPGPRAADRVRAFVEDFRERSPVGLPMTRAQIARHLGLAEETVVRAFTGSGRQGRDGREGS